MRHVQTIQYRSYQSDASVQGCKPFVKKRVIFQRTGKLLNTEGFEWDRHPLLPTIAKPSTTTTTNLDHFAM